MCGLFALLGEVGEVSDEAGIVELVGKISYRGPDNSTYKKISDNVLMGFHRLSIMDESELGNQPMVHPDDSSITIICNGEIYNYNELKDLYGIKTRSDSDCEVILHLYKMMPMKELLSKLDGVFAFVISDTTKDVVYAARDSIGVRPLFIGKSKGGRVAFSSEAKSIVGLSKSVKQFPPGTFWESTLPTAYVKFYNYRYRKLKSNDESEICKNINELLTSAVRKRLMSDREIGCLLSGGLDSSLIASLVQRDITNHSKKSSGPSCCVVPKRIKTFSIGMAGSPDLKYAKKVALWIGSEHHEVLLEPQDFLDAIREVIYKIESYDTTTVRASVGNYLVSKYIKENTDCKVIFNGDGADEVCAGYVYNKDAPTPSDLQKESVRLVKELHYFDVLRSDRSISSNGLEPRTPFLDVGFVNYYMSIPPELKSFDKVSTIEKRLLRKAFSGQNLLPEDVLWRDKCAFSDGVSSAKNSWHKLIQNYVDSIISDEEFESQSGKIKHCKPLLKESLYYRNVYREFFEGSDKLIPHFWMPQWTDVIDPSARELSGYKE